MYFTHTSWRWNFCICGLDTSVCVNRLAWSPATTWLSPIPGDAIFNHRQSSQNLLLSSKKKTKKQSYGIISLFLSLPSRGITHRQDPYNTMYWEYICTSSTGTTDDILLLLLLLISVSRLTVTCNLHSFSIILIGGRISNSGVSFCFRFCGSNPTYCRFVGSSLSRARFLVMRPS